MVSIILVGRNESWRLTKCLTSISNLINSNSRLDFETIYVDSKSTDDSIARAKEFSFVKIFQITGIINSAIARNIGAKEATGDILFFIDSDMEIQNDFLAHVINENGELKHDYLTGHLDDCFYTVDNDFIGQFPRTYKNCIPTEIQYLSMNGGLFMIKTIVWSQVNGMRNKYRRSQDLDLTIRLKEQGFKIARMPHLAAIHHTIDYDNERRMWEDLRNKYIYFNALIFREHILNFDVISRTLRNNYTAFLLLLMMILFCILDTFNIFYVYGTFLLMRVFFNTKQAKSTKSKLFYFVERIFYQFSLDVAFWIGFVLYFPKNYKAEYRSIIRL